MGLFSRVRATATPEPAPSAAQQQALDLIARGNAMEHAGEASGALRLYDDAIRLAPNLARAHLNRGNALLELGDPEAALAAYRNALDRDPAYASAHFNSGNAYWRTGRHADALAAYRNALVHKPDFADAEVASACVLEDLGRRDEAVACYRRALALDPAHAPVHANLGNALHAMGQLAEAAECYRRALAIEPGMAHARRNLGGVLHGLGRFEDAATHFRDAVSRDPLDAGAHAGLGAALTRLGRLDEAVASFERALAIAPGDVAVEVQLGGALRDLRRHGEAIACYRRAIESAPDFAYAHFGLGNAQWAAGNADAALASFRRAVACNPGFAEAHHNLGNVLLTFARHAEAADSYRRALEIRPDFADAHTALGNALIGLRQHEAAAASYGRALAIDPASAEAHRNLGECLYLLGRLDEAQASFRSALRIQPDFAQAQTGLLFTLSHDEATSPEALFAEHCRFGARFETGSDRARHANDADPDRRLRIGFVSADLRDHPVASFLEPLLGHLAVDAAVELHAYHNHPLEDAVTRRLRRHFAHWTTAHGLADDAFARAVEGDRIDVLIDLSGHTGGNRLRAFALKPAPIQASWLGYPGTTGLRGMDYYLADRFFLPTTEFAGQFTEKLVHLPAAAPFLPAAGAPDVNALPALANGHVTFGSFNRLSKLRPPVIALWSRLLRALPDSRLLLGGMPPDNQHQFLVDWFAREGIAGNRLAFHPMYDTPAYLALHHQVDLCLDTFPYSGGTTTAHALWMGVPTLSLAGRTPPGRHGATILGHVGLDAFVAHDAEDFERKALGWAANVAALADVRGALRARCAASVVQRPDLIAAGLVRALRIMWQRWCAGLPPEAFETQPDGETEDS